MQKEGVLKLLTALALRVFSETACDEELEAREEGAEEEGRLQPVRQQFIFTVEVALNTSHAQNAESVIYPCVPKRRKMFIRHHRFSSIVIRELKLMSCPRHLSLCRATR